VLKKQKKVGKIFKTGASGADGVIGKSHALKDFTFDDKFCGALDIIGCVSSSAGLVLGNIPSIKLLTLVTSSVTVSY